jgi:type IV pilus assembly protein PilM
MSLLTRQEDAAVGLDIDGDYLAAAVIRDGVIGRMASVPLPAGVTRDGEVVDPETLSTVLKDLFAAHKLPKRVRLGVANQQIVVRQLEMPLIAEPDERDRAIRFQAAEAIPMPLDEVVLDYVTVGAHETHDGAVRERLLVVAARTSMVDSLVKAVKGAGLKAEGIDLSAFAVVRVLGGPPVGSLDAEHPARAICHLGGVTNLAVAVGDVCVFTRPLQTAWSDDEDVINSVAEEIRLSLDFYAASPEARRVEAVVLSGPGAEDESVRDALEQRTGLAVSIAEPLGGLGSHTVPSLDDPYRYTVAAGLAMGATA